MAVTFLTAQTELRAAIGNPPAVSGPAATANLRTCLNDALVELVDKYRVRQAEQTLTVTTADGTASYALAATVESVGYVWDNTAGVAGRRLRKLPEDGLPATVLEPRGRPTHYTRSGSHLTLYPTPDGVYTVAMICRVRPTALANDTDVMPLPDSWKPAWLKLARYHYYDTFGNDPAKAREAYASFQVFVNDKPTDVEEESVDVLMGVDVGYASRGTSPRRTWDTED